VDNGNGFGFLWVAPEEAKAGTYEVRVNRLYFEKDTVRDFVVNVYAAQKVAIVDRQGKTSDASRV
jgi:phage anti-repressor protein